MLLPKLEDLVRMEKTTTDPEKKALLALLYVSLRYSLELEDMIEEQEDESYIDYMDGFRIGMMNDSKEPDDPKSQAFTDGYEDGLAVYEDMKGRFDGGARTDDKSGWVN